MVMGNNESTTTKNAGKSLAILIAMRLRRYDAGRISRWITSGASLEATGCSHWVSACAISPPQNTNKKGSTICTTDE